MAVTVTRYVNPDSSGGDGTTSATSGSTAAYASLAAWEAARARDLVTADEVEEVICASNGSADTAQLILSSTWVTDATRYIDIHAASGHRASPLWSTSKYRLTYSPTVSTVAVGMTSGAGAQGACYFRLRQLQIELTVNTLNAPGRNVNVIRLSPYAGTTGSDIRVIGNHIRAVGTAAFTPLGNGDGHTLLVYAPSNNGASPSPVMHEYNNILSWEAPGTYTGFVAAISNEFRNHIAYTFNNTINGSLITRGIWNHREDFGRITYAKNNILNGVSAALDPNFTSAYADYNSTTLSSMGYTSPGANERVSQTFTFVGGGDYSLSGSDTGALDFGVSDPSSGIFSDDIDGTTRSGTWDIGAHEYVSADGSEIEDVGNIASDEAFGSHTVANATPQSVTVDGVVTAEEFGSHTVANATPQSITPSGVETGESFGSATVGAAPQSITIDGMASAEAFGDAIVSTAVEQAITPSAVDSAEAFGDAELDIVVTQTITATGVASVEAFGEPTLTYATQTITVTGIASDEAFGSTTISAAVQTITPVGIASNAVFGATVLIGGADTGGPVEFMFVNLWRPVFGR